MARNRGYSNPLDPGAYRHQVQIQRRISTGKNAIGEDLFAWVALIDVYMSIAPLEGRELELARQTWADARYKLAGPYVVGIEREMRAVWWDGTTGKLLDILDVQDPTGLRQQIVLICQEWVR